MQPAQMAQMILAEVQAEVSISLQELLRGREQSLLMEESVMVVLALAVAAEE